MRSIRKAFVTMVILVGTTWTWGQTQRPARSSAWDELVRVDASVVDDVTIGWRERLILNVLTPNQAKTYFQQGADPQSLLLDSGQTLQEYLEQKLSPPGGVFVPLVIPCALFSSNRIEANRQYGIRVRGSDLGEQGGSMTGCTIPEEATAVLLQVRLEPTNEGGRLKLWAADGPEPAESSMEAAPDSLSAQQRLVVATLATEERSEGELMLRSTESVAVQGEVLGYFRAMGVDDQAGGTGISLYTESAGNNFFGTGAGDSTTGAYNSFFGADAGHANTTGQTNSFFGASAGSLNTTGSQNTAVGYGALRDNATGTQNTAVGFEALRENEASSNVAVGHWTLLGNVSGGANTAVGNGALRDNVVGQENTAVGFEALRENEASGNVAVGRWALVANSTGAQNTAVGSYALRDNVSGQNNTALGHAALQESVGSDNTAIGREAGSNATGSYNTFSGFQAGYGATSGQDNTGSYQSLYGYGAGLSNTTGYDNAFFGDFAGYDNTQGHDNAFLGSEAGTNNTTGNENAFVGAETGFSNQGGYNNSFLGRHAGFSNLDGYANTFLGHGAGASNVSGARNTFVGRATGPSIDDESYVTLLGAMSDGAASITNSTAIGYAAQVSQSNSLVLGSINGLNGASANTSVGIGTPAPAAPLHVHRADGTALLKVEETSGTTANRVLFRLTNNGAPWFKLLNSNTAQEWTFAMDQYDNFIFSRIGTGGAEFKIYQNGEVTMGPGGSEVFDLQPTGDLEITGGLTAGGIYYASDRSKKTDIESLDSARVLETIARLPISTWRFKTEDQPIRHAGPMAQDFYAAFRLGSDDKTISASDISGVALAAIQGLYEQLQEKDAQLAAQRAEIADLKTKLSEIEMLKQAVGKLQALLPGSGTASQSGPATD